jgi:hypothetical protein
MYVDSWLPERARPPGATSHNPADLWWLRFPVKCQAPLRSRSSLRAATFFLLSRSNTRARTGVASPARPDTRKHVLTPLTALHDYRVHCLCAQMSDAFRTLVSAVEGDDRIVGLVLGGSRGKGLGTSRSDYDVYLVAADGADPKTIEKYVDYSDGIDLIGVWTVADLPSIREEGHQGRFRPTGW